MNNELLIMSSYFMRVGLVVLNNWHVCILALMAPLLASCTSTGTASISNGKRVVTPEDAFVLPANYSVVGVVEDRARNGVTQKITLSTNSRLAGENYFYVQFLGPTDARTENTISYAAITDGRIARELRTEMAGIAMSRSPFYVQNNYGSFSYATGKAPGGDNCIYAWQQIQSPDHNQNFFQNRGRINLRLRLCETGADVDKLLSAMYGFTINTTNQANSWNPYGEPASPSPNLGRPGNPVFPPAVKTELAGPFPASDLNSSRLNKNETTFENAVHNKQQENRPRDPSSSRSTSPQSVAPHSAVPAPVKVTNSNTVIVPPPPLAGQNSGVSGGLLTNGGAVKNESVQVPSPCSIIKPQKSNGGESDANNFCN
ncbi:cellulose biosynthesis protein BcsN [Ochrobactrum sp. MYb379]|uniref:cellulose biosynthesis protein BcsN n=1 Tax=Ochrobactrum sp. MYb379 TaxID=2745275 RepID=UPI0030A05197